MGGLLPAETAGRRVVVVSPHLDDGVLSLGAAISAWSRAGARVELGVGVAGVLHHTEQRRLGEIVGLVIERLAVLERELVAHGLGRFAGADLGGIRWLARDQLRDRMRRVDRNGGWRTLARTTVAE